MTEREHPSPRALEAHVAAIAGGEPGDAELAGHVAACARCGELIAGLGSEREALLARMPAARFVREVAARRARGERRLRRRWFAVSGGAVAAVAAATVLWLLPTRPDGLRAKGIGVELYRKRAERVEQLGEPDRVRAGDGLRVSLTLPVAQRVSLSFVDAHGHVDPYVERALPAGPTLLPGVTVDTPCVDLTLVITTPDTRLERAIRCE